MTARNIFLFLPTAPQETSKKGPLQRSFPKFFSEPMSTNVHDCLPLGTRRFIIFNNTYPSGLVKKNSISVYSMAGKDTCYCCGSIDTSREHLPPKCLFEKPRPNLITVPSCDRHNSEKSKDDEYFRWFIATASSEDEKAKNLAKTKVIRAFKRKPALLHEIWRGKVKKIDIHAQDGTYLYSRPGFIIDSPRIQNILTQLCKGLFYHHFNQKFPQNYIFQDFIIYPNLDEDTKKKACALKICDVGDGSVFSYRYMPCSEDPNIVMWFLMFFSHFLIMMMSDEHVSQSQPGGSAPK